MPNAGRFLLALCFALASLGCARDAPLRPSSDRRAIAEDELSFSNTAEWGFEFSMQLSRPAPMLGAEESRVTLPPPPANSSAQTHAELARLREYQGQRTPERIAEITREMDSGEFRFGGTTLGAYLTSPNRTSTGRAIRAALDEVAPILFRFKRKFDRVRPHKLDPTLEPLIDVPQHPAYPSGHSTQAHVVAFLLSEIAPARRTEFERDALRIAVNREVAGVHYPSDTAAGALLARQVLDHMLLNAAFARLVEEARAEWRV